MVIYIAQPTELYNSDMIKELKNKLYAHPGCHPGCVIIDPAELPLPETKYKGKRRETFYEQMVFFPAIKDCNIFIGVSRENEKMSVGVRDEMGYAINQNKQIYRAYYDEVDIKHLVHMDDISIRRIIIGYQDSHLTWVLKTMDDYKKWYGNNPEAIQFLKEQFPLFDNGARNAVVAHMNSLAETYNHSIVVKVAGCKFHNWKKHAFIDPRRQERGLTCPYVDETYSPPAYDTTHLRSIEQVDMNMNNVNNLLTTSRAIHRSMLIFRGDAFERNTCAALLDSHGKTMRKKDGRAIFDPWMVVGATPVFDIDIKGEYKKAGVTIFREDIFEEYQRVINDILPNFIADQCPGADYEVGFSGNGEYCLVEPIIFSDYGWTYDEWIKDWDEGLLELVKIFRKKSINKIVPELKYGWNRYFKVPFSFHLSKERISIPLNKDEQLDHKWLDNVTKIETGLQGNVVREIIKKANW